MSYALLETVDGVEASYVVTALNNLSQNFPAQVYGKSYSYKVAACLGADGNNGCTLWSDDLAVEVKPAVPANLGLNGEVSPVTDGAYDLTWDTVDAGTGAYYELEEKSAALNSGSFGAWNRVLLSSPSTNSHTVNKTGADFEKDYQYQVRVCASNDACGNWSGPYGLSLKFAQPVLSTVSAASYAGDYVLSWASVTGAERYVLEEEVSGSWTDLGGASLSATSYSVIGKPQGTARYRVKACSAAVCGDWSAEFDVTVPSLGNPALTLDAKDDDEDNEYEISWTSVTGALRYELLSWEGDLSPEPADSAALTVTAAEFTALSKAYANQKYQKSYHYKIRACAGNNCSDFAASTAVTANVMLSVTNLVPAAVAGNPALTVDPNDGEHYTSAQGDYVLSWDSISVSETYLSFSALQECTSDCGLTGAGWSSVSGVTGTSVALTGKSVNTSYNYRIRICNDENGCSPYTRVRVSVGEPLDAPTGLSSDEGNSPSVSNDGEYTLSWNSVDRAVNYALIETVDGNSSRHIVAAPGLSITLTNRIYGKTYSYRVAACIGGAAESDGSCVEQTGPEVTVEIKPAVPAGLSGSSDAGGSYSLSWTAFTVISSYTLTYNLEEVQKMSGIACPAAAADWSAQAGYLSAILNANAYDVGGASAKARGEEFCYRVQACYNAVCGGWSASHAVAVPALIVPPNFRRENQIDVYDNSYAVRWDSVSGAARYELKAWRDNYAEPSDDACEDSTDTSCESAGLSQSQTYADQDYNQSYSYKVRSCAGSNCSDWSNILTVRVSLHDADAGSIAASPAISSDGNYTVSWASVVGAARYEIQESYDDGVSYQALVRPDSAVLTENFTDSAPAGHSHAVGRSYKYRIRACSDSDADAAANTYANGENPKCSAWAVSADGLVLTGLGQVTGLVIGSGSDILNGAYSIEWNTVAGLAGAVRYEIQEKRVGTAVLAQDQVFTDLNTNVTSISLAFTNQPGHGAYEYQVRACEGAEGSSDEICGNFSAVLLVDVVLALPANLSSNEVTSYDGRYRITWDSAARADSYELQEKIATDANWPANNVYSGANLRKNITKTVSSSALSYEYRVRSCGALGCPDYDTSALSVTVRMLSAPLLVVGDDPDDAGSTDPENPSYDGSFSLNWTTVAGAQAYKLEQSSNGGLYWTEPAPVGNASSYEIGSSTALSADSYQFRISACANASCGVTSAASGVQAVEVYDFSNSPFLSTSDTVSDDGSYTLSWTSQAGAERYELREGATEVYSGASLAHAVTGQAVDGTTYNYSARACGERNVCTDWTNPAVAVRVESVLISQNLCTGTISGNFQSGSGTAGDPYVICNENQLDNMRNDLDGHYKLGQDINGGYWVPVGDASSPFTGSLQGAGFAVSDLNVSINNGAGVQYGGSFWSDGKQRPY